MGCLPEQFSSEPFLFQIHAISITPKHYQLKEITEFGVSAGRAVECFCPEKVLTGRQGRRERQEAWLLHSFQRIRGLRGVEQLLWQIEALFDLSIHHLRCGFPDSSHTPQGTTLLVCPAPLGAGALRDIASGGRPWLCHSH